MLGIAKRQAFRLLSTNRDALPMRMAHKVATFVEAAYHNRGSDFFLNGERNVIERLAPAGCRTVFDVGANAGNWSKAALDLWPGCTVHAFEVAPRTADRFAAHLAPYIEEGRALLSRHGLSDCTGELEMFYYPDADELTSYSKRHPEHKSVAFTGQIDTLDHYCARENIDEIDFLKIDIEGHEFKVIRGGSDIMKSGKVACLQFEYGAFSTGSRFLVRDYYDLLPDYWIGKVFPRHVAFGEYDWTFENFEFCNYVAVHRSRPELKEMLST